MDSGGCGMGAKVAASLPAPAALRVWAPRGRPRTQGWRGTASLPCPPLPGASTCPQGLPPPSLLGLGRRGKPWAPSSDRLEPRSWEREEVFIPGSQPAGECAGRTRWFKGVRPPLLLPPGWLPLGHWSSFKGRMRGGSPKPGSGCGPGRTLGARTGAPARRELSSLALAERSSPCLCQ